MENQSSVIRWLVRLTLCATATLPLFMPMGPPWLPIALGLACGLGLGWSFTITPEPASKDTHSDSFFHASGFPETQAEGSRITDPWAMHRQLMQSMRQALPVAPMMSRDVLMYYAMLLEESAEIGKALVPLLPASGESLFLAGDLRKELGTTRQLILSTTRSMSFVSRRIGTITDSPAMLAWKGSQLSITSAKALLDGLCVLQTSSAGVALSAGLPIEAGYKEVMQACLSRAISPDPGSFSPRGADLYRLLKEHFPDYAAEEAVIH